MGYRNRLKLLTHSLKVSFKESALFISCVFFLIGFSSSNLRAQENTNRYKVSPYPDFWFNSVDGIRGGVRFLGEMEDSFKDGPHQLDAGFWISSKFPDLPVSYYFSLIEPIPALTDYRNEASIQFISSIRTGFSQHNVAFNKRWQKGFNEYNFQEIRFEFSREKLIDSAYRPFPLLWDENWKNLLKFSSEVERINNLGRFGLNLSLIQNIKGDIDAFTVGEIEIFQNVEIAKNLGFYFRGFSGLTSSESTNEYLFSLSTGSQIHKIENGISRARGTIPQNWLEAGFVHTQGGANLRGYSFYDYNLFADGENALYRSIWAVNTELQFPNPVEKALQSISVVGPLIQFKSYAFFDFGEASNYVNTIGTGKENIIADVGLGLQFSANIPDYLGKDRAIFVRYDMPLWLSDPINSDDNFKFRNLLGVGAIFNF